MPAKGFRQIKCKRGHLLTEETRFANGACKICRNLKIKEWHENNPEKVKNSRRKWRESNPEKAKNATEAWRLLHLKERGISVMLWQRLHPLTKAQKERKAENFLQWAKNNPDRMRAIAHKHRAFVEGNGGYFTAEEWFTLCFACGFRCLCCGEVKPLAADHVMPVSKGGTSWLHNIQPLCRECNSRKGTKTTDYRCPQEIQCKTQQNTLLEYKAIELIPMDLERLSVMV